MSTITLKNAAGQDVVYTEVSRTAGTINFVHNGTSLLDSARLTLKLVEKADTNRVIGKLSIPSVDVVPTTGVQSVLWTEVGSFDLSSVLAADTAAANDFAAQFASLCATDTVKGLYTTGVFAF